MYRPTRKTDLFHIFVVFMYIIIIIVGLHLLNIQYTIIKYNETIAYIHVQ